jgi:glycosyltransferase involved in cell wall biosynthesis
LTLEEKNIPDGDIIIATAWETAEWVTTFSKVKGKKVYYIQHYETWSGPKERVDATWQLPIAKIVIARWLKELGEREFNAKIIGPLFNPVDTNLFYPEGKRVHRGLRVGMLHHPAKWKGLEDGLEAFRIAREAVPSLKLVMISAQRRINIVPKDVEFHLRPVQSELRKIYSSCDIWMCSSWSEGYHLMPFEAMACGCALVSTLIGGVEDSCADGVNALLSPSRDPQKMAENLIKVAKNDKLRNRLVANGFYVIKSITWKKQIIQFETILHKILKSNAEEIDDPVNNYSK